MKILVTGGAGYIGSVLVPSLLDGGHSVTVIDNFLYGENSLAPCASNPKFRAERVDCRDARAVNKFLPGMDAVIPLAALVGAPICDLNRMDAELINLRSPISLFNALSDDQLCIMPTTESVYGSAERLISEDQVLNPLSTYGRHKVHVECSLMARKRSISLRLATVFGMSPRMRLDLLVNDFTWRALKDRAMVVFEGHFRRTCSHIRDVASAFKWALDGKLKEGEIYNVGACTMTKLELCAAIEAQVPGFTYVEAEVGRDQDQRDYIVSDEKIRKTGFEPQITLDDGIAELLRGYKMLSNNRYGNMP
jgi:nucleoside-diphosphate-sugar epimerase